MQSETLPVPGPSAPVHVERLTVNVLAGEDAETHLYADATYQWTDHGTLLVIGRRTNGYNSPRAAHTEYPPHVVTSTEVSVAHYPKG